MHGATMKFISKYSLVVWDSKINLMERYDVIIGFNKMLKTSTVVKNIVTFCVISNKPVTRPGDL